MCSDGWRCLLDLIFCDSYILGVGNVGVTEHVTCHTVSRHVTVGITEFVTRAFLCPLQILLIENNSGMVKH